MNSYMWLVTHSIKLESGEPYVVSFFVTTPEEALKEATGLMADHGGNVSITELEAKEVYERMKS